MGHRSLTVWLRRWRWCYLPHGSGKAPLNRLAQVEPAARWVERPAVSDELRVVDNTGPLGAAAAGRAAHDDENIAAPAPPFIHRALAAQTSSTSELSFKNLHVHVTIKKYYIKKLLFSYQRVNGFFFNARKLQIFCIFDS